MNMAMKFSDIRSRLKKGHLQLWGGAFFLAAILWVFVISENRYTYIIEMPIEVRNIKEGKTLKGEVVPTADVRFMATGRAILKTLLLKSISNFKMVLDLEKISTSYDFDLNEYYDKYSQKVVVPSGFELEFIEVVRPDSIHISLDDVMEKKVWVIITTKIHVAPGFIQVGELRYTPEEILLTGPEEIIAEVDSIETKYQSFENLTSSLNTTIPIDLNFPRVVASSHRFVGISADIQSIGERIISEVPVEIINVPEALRVFPSPSTVSLTITGGVEYIAEITANDLKVYLDFSKQWTPRQVYYTPNIEVPGEIIQWRDLSPKNIELRVTKIQL